MKRKALNENEIRTVLAVFKEIERKGFHEMNKMLGSLTIEEMMALRKKLHTWYQSEVLELVQDEETGEWYEPITSNRYVY